MSDRLLCMFSAEVIRRDGRSVVEVPAQELEMGTVREGEQYRVALLPPAASADGNGSGQKSTRDERPPEPPVEEGELREVEIEDIGDQGDGITRVERGFVVIVPETEQGERVTIEITDVQQNVAFAEVVERQSHF